jgi:hypothetical protein
MVARVGARSRSFQLVGSAVPTARLSPVGRLAPTETGRFQRLLIPWNLVRLKAQGAHGWESPGTADHGDGCACHEQENSGIARVVAIELCRNQVRTDE